MFRFVIRFILLGVLVPSTANPIEHSNMAGSNYQPQSISNFQGLGFTQLALTENQGRPDALRQKLASEKITTIQPFNTPPAVANAPQDLCNGEWHGAAASYDPGWFQGQEFYAVYQDPTETGCTSVYPFDVTNVYWTVFNSTGSMVFVDMQPVIYAVDLSNPTCPKPGVVLCRGPLLSTILSAGATAVIAMPFDVACCVSGPYFAGVECPTTIGTASMAIFLDDGTSLRNCANYNNRNGLWEDLVVDHSFAGNLKLWSDGYTSNQNLCGDCPARIETGDDLWVSGRDGNLFPSSYSPPIPADFFGPGSDPLPGPIDLIGEPFVTDPPGVFGQADAIIRRLAPIDGSYSGTGPQPIPVEIVALSLVGADPVSVEFNGGATVELWDIDATVSKFSPSSGTAGVTSDCCEGGEIDLSDILIIPRLTFTRQSDGDVRVFDYDTEGLPPVPCEITAGKWTGVIPPPSNPNLLTSPGLVSVDGILTQPSSQFLLTGDQVTPWFPDPCPFQICFESTGRIAFTDSPSAECDDPSALKIIDMSSALNQLGRLELEPGPYFAGQTIPAEIIELELSGSLPGLGEVIIRERADKASTGQLEVIDVSGPDAELRVDGSFELFIEIEIPGTGQVLNTGDEPFIFEAICPPPRLYPMVPYSIDPSRSLPVELQDATTGSPAGTMCGFLWRPEYAMVDTHDIPSSCEAGRPTGACCTSDGGCTDGMTRSECEQGGGIYAGDNSTCATATCPSTWTVDSHKSSGQVSLLPDVIFPPPDPTTIKVEWVIELGPTTIMRTEPGPYTEGQVIETELLEMDLGGCLPSIGPVRLQERADKTSQGKIIVKSVNPSGDVTEGSAYLDLYFDISFPADPSAGTVYTRDIPIRLYAEITELPLQSATFSRCLYGTETIPIRLLDRDTDIHWGWIGDFSVSGAPDPVGDPFVGVEFNQVDFTYKDAPAPNSAWGRVEIDVPVFTADQGLAFGYLNAYTDLGWAVQNVLLDNSDGVNSLAYYFQIACVDGTEVTELSAHLLYTPDPQETVSDGGRRIYPVTSFDYNAEGGSGQTITSIASPMSPGGILFAVPTPTERHTQPSDVNVQAAASQCAPMAVANSLQYLENEYGLPVPHDHVKGLRGDNSLVGQLDETMDRPATSRTDGDGVYAVQLMDGKFEYLKENGLDRKLINKHQGYGWGGDGKQLPTGNYSSNGVTSADESTDGKVTWEWICGEIAKGEDVELWFSQDDAAGNPTGGHAVRAFECGKMRGVPYVRYVHDARQTNFLDPTDQRGVETVFAHLRDLDEDGMLNFESRDRELRFAFSESADTDRDSVTNELDNAPDHFNPGQEDGDENDIGDVAEGSNLETNAIATFGLDTDGTAEFGLFPNPAPPTGTHKDMWFVGTATASEASSARVIVSFDYVDGEGAPVLVPPKDTTEIRAGKTLEIFGSIRLDFCPASVSVHFESLDGPVSDVSGNLNHICYATPATNCCFGRVGDANGSGDDEPTIGDISVMIDALFITGSTSVIACLAEADINQSGGADPLPEDITIGDISYLIDYLFITGPTLGLSDCL